jgi:hypothetical protein
MKTKNTFFFFLLASLAISFSSCKKNKTGDFEVNVIDGLGNSVGSGKTVYLYFGNANYNSGTYTKTFVTKSSGQAQFFDLAPGDYYADCDWQNQLGFTITSSGSGSVEEKKVTSITIAP